MLTPSWPCSTGYVQSGVDLALDEAPHDRYADSARTAVAQRPQATDTRAPTIPLQPQDDERPRRAAAPIAAPDEAIRAAEQEASSARDLDELAARLADFPHAPFRDMAQHFLFGAGAPAARLIAFDAAPGVTEETSGEAFSGLSAKLLDNMLAAIGFDRSSASLAYVSPWRPPGDRALSPHEAAIFAPFARRRVELARPDILLIFGEAPARIMLTTNEPVGKLRGKAFEARCGAHVARAFVFSSLEAMLKSAALKPAAWRDLRRVAAALESASNGAQL
ncbi:uracil-DNA glycosylase family protein [Methylocystis sp. SB2]|uniref:uracil-DNA glycosylase n=1 Tax=Methylocystis sp. (strain SB2) TaxID=743836 RepID=UPI001EFB177D|nr:uracil-DNA glycosylase [Methylocystis sp. SB2]ULO22620.1 uracil-DNA glycosylase [Methylocystis sp. SB2]